MSLSVAANSPAWWTLTPRRLLAAMAPIALLVLAARPETDPDLWWHLRTGLWILDNGTVPHTDPFSFTMTGTHWVAHEWLADIGLYALYRLGDFAALTLATTIVVALTFTIVYKLSSLRPHVAIFTTILAAAASAVTWGPRPQMLTMLFSSVTLWILMRGRQRQRWLWLLPLLLLLWANVHSGFFLGLAIVAATLAGELAEKLLSRLKAVGAFGGSPPVNGYVRTLTLSLACSLITAAINPNGMELLIYPFFTLTSKAMQTYIIEWHSPDFHDVRFLPFAAMLLLLICVLALSRQRPTATEILLLAGLGFEALVSLRNIPLFAIAAAPILTRQIEAAWVAFAGTPAVITVPGGSIPMRRGLAALNWLLLGLIAVAALVRIALVVSAPAPVSNDFPVETADFLLASRPAGPMLNSYNFGGYFIWRLYPTYKVFIDGRADVYGDAFMDEYYARIWQGRGDWQGYLDRFNINLVVMEKDGVMAALMRGQPEWRVIHQDGLAVVFQRAKP